MPIWQGIAAHALRAGNTQTAVYFTKCAHHAARRAQQALLDSLEDERRSSNGAAGLGRSGGKTSAKKKR